MIKATLIIPVRNEEKSINLLLDSILNQSKVPDEVIFVDGFSSDNTFNIISKFSEKHKFIKVLREPKSNKIGKISIARNFAITNAKNDYIVCTDAGCKLDRNWFKKMVEPFENGVDIVVGNYKALINSDYDYSQSLVSVNSVVDRNGDIILSRASSRSIAFKKECWKNVGGYPENLYTGEDTKFNYLLKEKNYKFYFVRDALVYWNMHGSMKDFIKQNFKYGLGDGRSAILSKMPIKLIYVFLFWICLIAGIISLVFKSFLISYIVSIFLLYFTLELLITIIKKYNKMPSLKFLLQVIIFIVLKRISYVFGISFGYVKRFLYANY